MWKIKVYAVKPLYSYKPKTLGHSDLTPFYPISPSRSFSQHYNIFEKYLYAHEYHQHQSHPHLLYLSYQGAFNKRPIYPIKAPFKAYIINTPIIAPPPDRIDR
jgi:hypothetical protein